MPTTVGIVQSGGSKVSPYREGKLGCHFKVEHIMTNVFTRFVRDETGATAIEYGLIAALVSVVIITGLTLVGTSLNTMFTKVAGDLR